MPRKAINFSNTVIYKIACKDVSVKDVYVGSTTDVAKRRYEHKSRCGNENGERFHLAVYAFIRRSGGWENWELVVIEAFPCKSSEEQRTRERYWLEALGATLNANRPIRTLEDFHLDWQNYAESHREERSERQKVYADKNRAKIRERARELVQCECGDELFRGSMHAHKKGIKHLKAMAAK